MSNQTLFTVITFNLLVLFVPVVMFLLYKRPQLWLYLLTLFLGVFVGLTDLRTDDPQLPALLLIVFGLFAGFAQPRRAWQWALILAVWIPFFGAATRVAGLNPASWADVLFSFIALIPALAGAYAGALVKRFSPHVEKRETH